MIRLRYIKRYSSLSKSLLASKALDMDVNETDISTLYRALQAPVTLPDTGPIASRQAKLQPDYLKQLQVKYENLEISRSSDLQRRQLQLQVSLERPTLRNITELIHVNALSGRAKEAQLAFDQIAELGMSPDLVSWNHLLNAYVKAKLFEDAVKVFEKLQVSHKPDLVTYSTLVSGCIRDNQLDRAFEYVTTLREAGLYPNLIIFTTLISGCIKAGQIERAWKTFNFLRVEVAEPDAIAFNLMVHTCSKTKDAERALDLVQEMRDRGLMISNVTLTSLIQACGSRKDYYHEAFNILEQMAVEGHGLDEHTFNVLLSACNVNGDIGRGRLVWNQRASQGVNIQPKSYQTMFQLYTRAFHEYSKGKRWENAEPMAYPTSELPILNGPLNLETLIKESKELWDELSERSSLVTQAYLELLCAIPIKDSALTAINFFADSGLNTGYLPIVQLLSKNKELFNQRAEVIFQQFLSWDQSQEEKMSHCLESERETRRKIEGRDRKTVRDILLWMCRGHARNGDIQKSLDVLEQMTKYRYPTWIAAPMLKDIPNVLILAQSKADSGEWEHLKRVVKLCPKPNDTIGSVQAAVAKKTMAKDWWGWGSRNEGAKLLRVNTKRTMKRP